MSDPHPAGPTGAGPAGARRAADRRRPGGRPRRRWADRPGGRRPARSAGGRVGPAGPGGRPRPGPVLVLVLRRRHRRATGPATPTAPRRRVVIANSRPATRHRRRHPGAEPGAAPCGSRSRSALTAATAVAERRPGGGALDRRHRRHRRRRGGRRPADQRPARAGLGTPCATAGSAQWYFADRRHPDQRRVAMSLLNPVPDRRRRGPVLHHRPGGRAAPGVPGPGRPAGGLLTVNLGDHLRRRQAIATTVTARSGRVVAWKTDVVTPPTSGGRCSGRRPPPSPLADPAAPIAGRHAHPGRAGTGHHLDVGRRRRRERRQRAVRHLQPGRRHRRAEAVRRPRPGRGGAVRPVGRARRRSHGGLQPGGADPARGGPLRRAAEPQRRARGGRAHGGGGARRRLVGSGRAARWPAGGATLARGRQRRPTADHDGWVVVVYNPGRRPCGPARRGPERRVTRCC